jgi:hypothetical protein
VPLNPLLASLFGNVAADGQAEAIASIERDIKEQRLSEFDQFPAKLTSCHTNYDPPRCAWTEQEYDKDGQRVDKAGGRFGTSTYMPAFAVGNGTLPAASYPVQVWMRSRIDVTTNDLGPVFEYDWQTSPTNNLDIRWVGTARGQTFFISSNTPTLVAYIDLPKGTWSVSVNVLGSLNPQSGNYGGACGIWTQLTGVNANDWFMGTTQCVVVDRHAMLGGTSDQSLGTGSMNCIFSNYTDSVLKMFAMTYGTCSGTIVPYAPNLVVANTVGTSIVCTRLSDAWYYNGPSITL